MPSVKEQPAFPRWYRLGPAETRDPTLLKALICTQEEVNSARYDSLDSPRGTSYGVPTGKTLYITKVQGRGNVAPGTGAIWEIGYGDNHVENSAATPTNAVAVWALEGNVGNNFPESLDIWAPIPAGKYPYAKFTGGAWTLSALGIEV